MMKQTLFNIVLLLALVSGALFAPMLTFASHTGGSSASACTYDSTQVRVQNSATTPWSSEITVSCGQSFRLAGFHNNSGQLASDVSFSMSTPQGPVQQLGTAAHGVIDVPAQTVPGKYVITGVTGQASNWRCSDVATVNVVCTQPPVPAPVPVPGQCQYSSTQARVQKDAAHHWQEQLNIFYGESFNVGSFHNGTGQFAPDTVMTVRGRVTLFGHQTFTIERVAHNGEVISPILPGEYTLQVKTVNQSGSACEASATVTVTSPNWLSGGWRVVQQ